MDAAEGLGKKNAIYEEINEGDEDKTNYNWKRFLSKNDTCAMN